MTKRLAVLVALAVGCGSSDTSTTDGGGTPPAGGFTIGGTILTAGASGLVIATPPNETLTIPASYQPPFAFPTKVPTGTPYNVQIVTQPGGGATCSIGNGVGTVENADVTNVTISCAIQLP